MKRDSQVAIETFEPSGDQMKNQNGPNSQKIKTQLNNNNNNQKARRE